MARDIRQSFAVQAKLARKRFLESLHHEKAGGVQAAMLTQCLANNAGTVFGREHGFGSIADLAAYKVAVPIRHYEELAAWIDRAADGEPAVLTKEDPVRFWKTTGTTSKSKRIPVTPAFANRSTESFFVLQGTQQHYCPGLSERSDTILFTHLSPRPIKERLGGRFPFCTTTEVPVEVRRGHEDMLAPWLLPLQSVVDNDAERLYFLLCFAALHDLLAIGCLHPSRFQTVVSLLHGAWPRLVRELRDGTILGAKIRDARPDRAKELEAIASRSGTLRPIDVWPNLKLATAWSGTYAARYLPVLKEAFTSSFLPMPSISSECFTTMTIDEDPIGQPLNISGAVFEFIPAGDRVDPATATLDPHELAQGTAYEVIITTLGGLYRYATCDIFRVIGFVQGVPRLEYVGRRAVSDLTGEKLAEEQVATVVGRAFAELGIGEATFTVCGVQAVVTGKRPRYVMILEVPEPLTGERLEALERRLESGLCAVNSRYEMKRNFDDLDPMVVELVPAGTFGRYRQRLVERGMPAGQLKDKVLTADGAPILAELRSLARASG